MKINLSECYTNNDEVRSITKVLKSGWLTSGKLTEKFENISKKKLKCKYAIATNSCTNGINSVLHASGLKKGDEVITSPLTFISTINNLYNFGLKIKFVDIDKSNYSIDIKKLKKSITKKTKCILVTHYGGVPCDIRKILEFIKKKNIFLIEDAATAFGSKINNKFIGSFKDSCAIFSFYPNKIITTGEGGLICTNNKTLAKKIRTNISCGIDKTPFARLKNKEPFKYDVTYPGFKYNFTDLQAALGIQQIKKIEKIIKYRKELRQKYYFHLKDLHSKDIISFLKIPKNFRSSEYIFTILLNPKKFLVRETILLCI